MIPPAAPRPGKTLCDDAVASKDEASDLLAEGVRRGLVSVQMRNNYPQNIWAVTKANVVLEAQLDNEQMGTYHGYPVPQDDPLRAEILKRWNDWS